ncbi:MAG: hypothetical protein PHV28_02545 [Kiritimatiellae bacterium]|nr:hypothetical protein [Kiritimatiellia bacterium]
MRALVGSLFVLVAGLLALDAAPILSNAAFNEYADGKPVAWNAPSDSFRIERNAGMNGSGGLVWENSDPGLYVCTYQDVALEHGKAYRFGVSVKVDSLAGARKGVFVCVEWTDAKGKWLGGSYTHHFKAPQCDWTRIESVTREVAVKEEIFLSVEPAPKPQGVPPELGARTWRHGGRTHLLVVNTTRKVRAATISVGSMKVEVRLEPIGVKFFELD